MQVTFESGDPAKAAADALIVPVGSDGDAPAWSPLANELDAALSGELSSLAADARFSGKAATTLVVPTLGRIPSRRIILAGLGPAESSVRPPLREWRAPLFAPVAMPALAASPSRSLIPGSGWILATAWRRPRSGFRSGSIASITTEERQRLSRQMVVILNRCNSSVRRFQGGRRTSTETCDRCGTRRQSGPRPGQRTRLDTDSGGVCQPRPSRGQESGLEIEVLGPSELDRDRRRRDARGWRRQRQHAASDPVALSAR